MSDVSEFDAELRNMIATAEHDLNDLVRASNNLVEVHLQMNKLRGLFDLVARDKQNFVRDFQPTPRAIPHSEQFGPYGIEDDGPLPRIAQAINDVRQQYREQGLYGQPHWGNSDAAE